MPALRAASFTPIEPAFLNAISDESTACVEPSSSVTLTSSTGYPARMPPWSASLAPCMVGPTYSFGTEPPTTLFSNWKPDAAFERLHLEFDDAVLAAATALADEAPFGDAPCA